MLFCPHCQQLEQTTARHSGGNVTYICKKCGRVIPLRRELKPGEVVAGFEIQEELGRGAMGIVYKARQTNLDREVAIKILSDDSASDEVYVERFFREARAAASLSHPNVVQAYDAGVTSDGIYYFVMERINGENLDLVLNNVGPLNVPQALNVFISVANALSYAWTRNQLSHGDIKPENIIMRLNGKVKLADFGLARRAKDPELAEEDIRATPAYAPPEIIRGDKDVPGFKSDMYSFGATMYHILIGHEPFVGTDPAKVCAMQLSDTQVPLSELNSNIPQRLSDLVDALMEKDPGKRPASWNDVVADLNEIRLELDSSPAAGTNKAGAGAGDGNGDPAQAAPAKRSPVALIAAVVIPLLAIAAAAVFFARSRRPEPEKPTPEIVEIPPAPSRPSTNTPSTRPALNPVRDMEFYRSKWQDMLAAAGPSGPTLEEVTSFVLEAGNMAPADATRMLKDLRYEQEQSRLLAMRNELLDLTGELDREQMRLLDTKQLEEIFKSADKMFSELKRADDAGRERIFTTEQRQSVETYLTMIAEFLADSKSSASSASGKKDTSAAAAEKKKDLMPVYQFLLDSLPETLRSDSERNEAIRVLNELLADDSPLDGTPRNNCMDILNFLLLNRKSLLPYLSANKNVLRGMKLFPKSHPESILDDISESMFRLKEQEKNASIIKKFSWRELLRDEGEDHILVTLINSPQLAKVSEDFREYLFVRALFLGVDPDSLKRRYDRASGLSAKRRNELNRIAGFFRRPESEEDEEEENLP